MLIETINSQDTIKYFHQLMSTESQYRIMLVEGGEKLGKSHLITKVFPSICTQDYKFYYALVDLRSKPQSTPDILKQIATQLKHDLPFDRFNDAYKNWLNKDKINIEDVKILFSKVDLNINPNSNRVSWEVYLTEELITDIEMHSKANVLFLFDQLENANKSTKRWLRETLLVQLKPLNNIRTVISGRSLLPMLHTYNLICIPHKLKQVRNEIEYIEWCRRIGIREDILVDQSIKDFARLLGYRPGLFAEYVLTEFADSIPSL